MPTSWTIAIDWDRNDNFTGSHDDVTTHMISAEWALGWREPYQDVAEDSVMKLRLTNEDRRFSPENATSPLYGKLAPFRPLRVQSSDGSTTRTHWVGWVESIEPSVNQFGEREVMIHAAGPGLFFTDVETDLALQENKRTDEIIDALLEEVVIAPPLSRAWLLGVAGNSEMGATTYLAETVIPHTLQQGRTTLAFAADNWVRRGSPEDDAPDTFNVYRAIKDTAAAERGRFFFDREGRAIFWNRHYLLMQTTVLATFNNTMTDLRYEYAGLGEFKNDVRVVCSPRTISPDANELLWKLEQPLTIRPGETRKFTASYKDSSDNRIGGKEVKLSAVTFSQGDAGIILKASANRATLEISNSGTQAAVLATAELRGKKITDFGRMEARAQEGLSIARYGRRTLSMNIAALDDLEDAQTIADFEIGRRGQPAGKVRSMTLLSHALDGGSQHGQQLARTMGDLVRVQEAQSGHDGQYFIIGEAHRINGRGEVFETTWHLEPATEGNWWLLGVSGRSELGTNTRATY
jgi:hypothetical protein